MAQIIPLMSHLGKTTIEVVLLLQPTTGSNGILLQVVLYIIY